MGRADPIFTAEQWAMIERAESRPPDQASGLLCTLAKRHWRAGETAQFADCFRRAYRIGPITAQALLESDGPLEELRAKVAALAREGAAYARVLSNLAICEAKAGNAPAVRRLLDHARFFRQGRCAPPPGMTPDSFNDAVAAEIKADLRYYDAPDERAIRHGWRHDAVMRTDTPALRALRATLSARVADYVAALPPDASHPFQAMRPAQLELNGWAVVSGADTYHLPHIHTSAWLVGVYYVTQPEVSRERGRGWLRVGPQEELNIGDAEGWESRLVEPVRGSFVLMPAYFWHATEPMGTDQERICIAFEVQHPEIRRGADD